MRAGSGEPLVPALALVWSREEPARVGEVCCIPRHATNATFTIGRAVEPGDDDALPLAFQRLRPFSRVETGPLRGSSVSRRQLRVRLLEDGGLLIEPRGRKVTRVNGHVIERAVARPGDLIEVEQRFSLLYTGRPASWPNLRECQLPFPFGEVDTDGFVGESPAIWTLRRKIIQLAAQPDHVLVRGPSGSGKELAVQALHRWSPQADGPMVTRNVAALTEERFDLELFGSARDYPRHGVPERLGLLAEANGGALFLDELHRLPLDLQARMLRVMDDGDYHRLGDLRAERSTLRIYGATDRDDANFDPKLLARFVLRLSTPGLAERREDIPLLARHIMESAITRDPEFQDQVPVGEQARVSASLAAKLVKHDYTGHYRELSELLWAALTDDPGPRSREHASAPSSKRRASSARATRDGRERSSPLVSPPARGVTRARDRRN